LSDRLKGYEAGADDYITKPYDIGELLAKIRILIKLKKTQDELLESNNQLEKLNNTLGEHVRIRSEQLVEAEKMASLGKHAAGIVHNLNNPLAAIMGYTQLLLINPKIKGNLDLVNWINNILKSSDSMKDIIASILTKSKSENSIEEKDIDLNDVVMVQLDNLKANFFFKSYVKLKTELGEIPM
jgi:signal transduction histidine kinase